MSLSVVTGAAGFVGQALVKALLAAGDTVRGIALPGDPNLSELRAVAPPDRLQVVEADITNAAAIRDVFAGATRAFHTAALVHAWAPFETFRAVNVGGTRNVARACQEHGVRLVAVSTTDVFGIPDAGEAMDETSPFKAWNEPYADSKIEAERWLWDFQKSSGLRLSIIYPGWVYGPGDKAFFPSLAQAIDEGVLVFWGRDIKLAWAYIDNLVQACVLASEHDNALGKGFIVHDEADGPTMEEVCGRIAETIGRPAPTRHIPYALALAAATILQTTWRALGKTTPPPLLSVDVKAFGYQWHLSSRRIREELGWQPRVSTADGMHAALNYLHRITRIK